MRRCAILAAVCVAAALAAGARAAPEAATLVRDVRVFDGERVQDHRSVLIAGGRIARIGGPRLSAPGARVVEGRGRTLLPGLIDAHVHLIGDPEGSLRQAARYGVTTVLDMFSGPKVRAELEALRAAPKPGLADARTAGYGATAPGSALSRMTGQAWPTVAGPQDAAAWVDARIAEGSDYIKVVFDEAEGGPLDAATLAAIVRAAHARRRLVVVHVLSEQKAEQALAAGADGLAHLYVGDAADPAFAARVEAAHAFVVPTLTILHSLCGRPVEPEILADVRLAGRLRPQDAPAMAKTPTPARNHLCQAPEQAVAALAHRRVKVLAGTDTAPRAIGAYGVLGFGASLHVELRLLNAAGLTPRQALAAATANAADAFGLKDRGRIRPGLRADLLLVDGDPTRDITATRNIAAIWIGGEEVPQP